MRVKGSQTIIIDITNSEMGRSIMDYVSGKLDVEDDAGCDWFTDSKFNIFIGDETWCVGRDINLAKLVDAANVLIYGNPMHLFAE